MLRPDNSKITVPLHPDNKLQSTGGLAGRGGWEVVFISHLPAPTWFPSGLTTLDAAHHSKRPVGEGQCSGEGPLSHSSFLVDLGKKACHWREGEGKGREGRLG